MVRQVNRQGVTIVLIEHVMRVIVGVCTRALVLNFGRPLTEGAPEAVLRDPRVIEAYLGERYARQAGGDGASPTPPAQGEDEGGAGADG
jgi:branched-chain amino acid transport system ATP-binding protein